MNGGEVRAVLRWSSVRFAAATIPAAAALLGILASRPAPAQGEPASVASFDRDDPCTSARQLYRVHTLEAGEIQYSQFCNRASCDIVDDLHDSPEPKLVSSDGAPNRVHILEKMNVMSGPLAVSSRDLVPLSSQRVDIHVKSCFEPAHSAADAFHADSQLAFNI